MTAVTAMTATIDTTGTMTGATEIDTVMSAVIALTVTIVTAIVIVIGTGTRSEEIVIGKTGEVQAQGKGKGGEAFHQQQGDPLCPGATLMALRILTELALGGKMMLQFGAFAVLLQNHLR